MASKSLIMRVPARPEHWLLGNKLWRIHWGVLCCKCTLGLQSQQSRCKRGEISSCHYTHCCRILLIALGQPFHACLWLAELQAAKAGTGACVDSWASVSPCQRACPGFRRQSQEYCLHLPLCVTSPPLAQDPDG